MEINPNEFLVRTDIGLHPPAVFKCFSSQSAKIEKIWEWQVTKENSFIFSSRKMVICTLNRLLLQFKMHWFNLLNYYKRALIFFYGNTNFLRNYLPKQCFFFMRPLTLMKMHKRKIIFSLMLQDWNLCLSIWEWTTV